MVKEENGRGEEEIEASGDAIIIAESIAHIGDGLFEIARAIREYTRELNGSYEDDNHYEEEYYLDGARK